MSPQPWPVRLTFRRKARELHAEFDDGQSGTVSFRRLRLSSPSAETRGHGRGPAPPPPILPDDLDITGAEPVGRYAVRLVFSDGHSTGLYTWSILRELTVG